MCVCTLFEPIALTVGKQLSEKKIFSSLQHITHGAIGAVGLWFSGFGSQAECACVRARAWIETGKSWAELSWGIKLAEFRI